MIAQMMLGVGFAALASGMRTRARVLARGSLRCEDFASRFDRSQAALTARLRQTRLAVTVPSPEDWLAA